MLWAFLGTTIEGDSSTSKASAQLIAQHYEIAGVGMIINPWVVVQVLSRSFFTAARPCVE
eukprot:COSAG02_NODE_484_length_21389_cov_9.202583_10_plen_60_part_00